MTDTEDDEREVFDTQAQCLLDAIEGAMAEGGAVISVCLGPPNCELQGEDAVQNMERHRPLSAAEQEAKERDVYASLMRVMPPQSQRLSQPRVPEQSPELPTEPESEEKPPHGDL